MKTTVQKWCLVFLSRPSGPSKALKLGAKGKEVDNFVDKLKSEGETIMPTTGKRGSDVSKALPPPVNVERYMHIYVFLLLFLRNCRFY